MPDTFQWSTTRRIYIWRSNGRVVTPARLEDWVEKMITQTKSNLRIIGEDLITGRINRAEWALRSGAEMKNMHRSLAMLANGGKSQMNNSKWGRLGQRLQSELRFFNSFATVVDNTEIANLGSKFLNRLESYADAGRGTYWSATRAREAAAGGQQEKNVLGGSARSCSECIAESAKGWVTVGTLSSPGSRQCGPSCHCSIDFRAATGTAESEAA